MQFQWTSALNTQALNDFKVQEVFIFEMAMVLSTKALAQINQAGATVDPSIDRFADAANLLKGAGGVFMALAQVKKKVVSVHFIGRVAHSVYSFVQLVCPGRIFCHAGRRRLKMPHPVTPRLPKAWRWPWSTWCLHR